MYLELDSIIHLVDRDLLGRILLGGLGEGDGQKTIVQRSLD